MNENQSPQRQTDAADKLPANQDTTVPRQTDQVDTKKRRKSRPLAVLLSLILIALLGGSAAIFGYQYFNPQKPVAVTTPVPAGSDTLSAKSVIASIKPLYDNEPLTDSSGVSVPIKVASFPFYTQIDASKASAISGSVAYTDSAIVSAKIAKLLKEKQFVERVMQPGSDDSMYVAHYTQADVVCEVTTTKTANNPTGNHQLYTACANMSDYIATASTQKPFYTVYPTKQQDDGTNLLFVGSPTITDSKTAKYKLATVSMGGVDAESTEVSVGGFAGLYYQTPDGKWHFFKGLQNTPQCSDFTTDDTKKAYAGTPCMDATGKETTVTTT